MNKRSKLAGRGRPRPRRVAGEAQSNVAELMGMLELRLTKMRTTYNGSYGTSLLFYPPTYYEALFQDKRKRLGKAGPPFVRA